MNSDLMPSNNLASSLIVKQAVRDDLKKRHITHQNIADQLEVKRQTVSNILSSDDFFSVRNAILFSSLLGYNREYLASGKGSLYKQNLEDELQNKVEKSESLRILYQDATFVLGEVCCIVSYNIGNDTLYKEIVNKAKNLYQSIRGFGFVSDPSNEYVKEFKSRFYKKYNELEAILIKNFDAEKEV